MERRNFFRLTGLGAASVLTAPHTLGATNVQLDRVHDAISPPPPERAASDEAFWHRIRAFYTPPADYIDLDQANTASTAKPVFDAFVERARWLSHAPAERFSIMWNKELDAVTRPELAAYLGAKPQQLAFMANATTALNTVLNGFPLARSDEILVTDHEYPDMVETVLQRGRREGVVMRVVKVPAATDDPRVLVTRVAEAITPRTKLLLISHVSAWSGEILPVAEVTAVARSHGVAVLVDAAQSVGTLDVDFDAIGCDFLAASLHKGLGAPVPTGVLVMRGEHVGSVWPLFPPSWDTTKHPMDLYEWAGTFNMAALASVSDALAFQRSLGAEQKRSRLRYLGGYWQDRLRDVDGVQLLSPRDPARWAGAAALQIDNIPSKALAKHLRQRRGVLVQDKAGRHSPFKNAIRVAPSPYTTPKELDRFVAAIREIAKTGSLA